MFNLRHLDKRLDLKTLDSHKITYLFALYQCQTLQAAHACLALYLENLNVTLYPIDKNQQGIKLAFELGERLDVNCVYNIQFPSSIERLKTLANLLSEFKYTNQLLSALEFFEKYSLQTPEYKAHIQANFALSLEQLRILQCLKQGVALKEIPNITGINCKLDMLNKRIAKIRNILGAKNNLHAVAIAIRAGRL